MTVKGKIILNLIRSIRDFDFKTGCKNESRIVTKKYAADAKISFPTKSILKQLGLTSPFRQRRS